MKDRPGLFTRRRDNAHYTAVQLRHALVMSTRLHTDYNNRMHVMEIGRFYLHVHSLTCKREEPAGLSRKKE